MKIAIESDDFSPRNSNFGLLEEMRSHFPHFKITLFTVPWEIRWGEQTPITLEKFRPFSRALKESQDWLEVAIHGLTHAPAEFERAGYDEARKRIIIAEKMFANQKIPFVRIFKAPFWQLSKNAERALFDLGYLIVQDGYFDWNLADNMPTRKPKKKGIYVAHSHVQETCGNGLEEVYPKLMNLPLKTKFYFLSEYFDIKKVKPEIILQTNGIPGIKKGIY